MDKETKKMYDGLTKDFPEEAMSKDTSRGFALTSIKAQYVRERLNQVMGVDGWESESFVIDRSEDGVAVKMVMKLHFPNRTVIRSAFGGCDAKEKSQTYGDLFKSADTDALSKAASQFGVGNEVFKGNVKPPGSSSRGSSKSRRSKKKTYDELEDL